MDSEMKPGSVVNIVNEEDGYHGHHGHCGSGYGGGWGGGCFGPGFLGGIVGGALFRRGGLFGGEGGYGRGDGYGRGYDEANEARYESLSASIADIKNTQNTNSLHAQISELRELMGQCCCDNKCAAKDIAAANALGLCNLQHNIDKCCCETNRNIDSVKLEMCQEFAATRREIAAVECGIKTALAAERERALYAKVSSLEEALERKQNACNTEAILAAIKHSGEESREATFRAEAFENKHRCLVDDIAREVMRRSECNRHHHKPAAAATTSTTTPTA